MKKLTIYFLSKAMLNLSKSATVHYKETADLINTILSTILYLQGYAIEGFRKEVESLRLEKEQLQDEIEKAKEVLSSTNKEIETLA
jgi:hypothetical protein